VHTYDHVISALQAIGLTSAEARAATATVDKRGSAVVAQRLGAAAAARSVASLHAAGLLACALQTSPGGGGSSGSDGSDGSGFPARVGGATTAKGRAAELRLARRANGQGDDDGGGDGDDPGSRGPLGADERMPSKPTVRFSCPPNAHPPTRWAEWCIGTSFFSTSLLRAETFSNFDYPPSNRKP
jgi:hypothetical protein